MSKTEFFGVEKIKLVAPSTAELQYGDTNSYGMFRTDNRDCLGVVGSQYVPVQNNALYDVVREAAELAGLDHEAVRFIELAGGRKVAFQVLLPEWDLTGDKVVRYASALNSHDGSSSLAMGMVGTRIICQNTWLMAYRNCSKARHSASITEQVKVMSAELIQSVEIDRSLFELFTDAKAQAYNEKDNSHFIKELIGYDLKDLDLIEDANTTKKRNKYESIDAAINEELVSAGSNMWGVFNGVTRYVNHDQAVRKEDPLNYIYFGTGKQLVDRTLKMLNLN